MMNQFSMNKVSFTRRIVSFLLALIMVTSLSAPAGAVLIAVTTTESRFNAGSFEVTSPDGTYSVHVNYGTDAGIPEGAKLVTSEVTDAAPYQSVVESKLPAGKTAVLSRFFDIDIVSESGESVQLLAPVEVVIDITDAPVEENTGVSVFHFPDEITTAVDGEDSGMAEVEITDDEIPLAAPEMMLRGLRSATAEGVVDEAVLTDDVVTEDAVLTDEETEESELIEEVHVTGNDDGTVSFFANGFSVYGVIYTVDFSISVDGQEFAYSLAGGSGIGMTELLPLLGVVSDDPATDYNEVLLFVDQIADVEFSDPSLIWVGKVETDTTVGDIVSAQGLDVEYSAELTEEEIEALNGKLIMSGDWALISLKAFDTEENLTVTMNNGEKFVVKLTDYQQTSDTATFKEDKVFIIAYKDGNDYYVLKTDGSTEKVENPENLADVLDNIDFLDLNYQWKFYYIFEEKGEDKPNYREQYYFIRPMTDPSSSISLVTAGEDLVQKGTFNIGVPYQEDYTSGFHLEGYSSSGASVPKLYFDTVTKTFRSDDNQYSNILVLEPQDKKKYEFKVNTAQPQMGLVAGKDTSGTTTGNVVEFETRTKDNKRLNWGVDAYATKNENEKDKNGRYRYVFDYFELNGQRVPDNLVTFYDTFTVNGNTYSYHAKIEANKEGFEIPSNGSVLTAHFKQNPSYVGGTDIEDLTAWLQELTERIMPLDSEATKKTAEVYDYENRIYRVDLTTRSDMVSLDGTVDLGLILDASGSMKFPSKLTPLTSKSDTKEIWTINDKVWVREGNRWVEKSVWETWNLNTSQYYYVIAETDTRSTVFRLFYTNEKWYRIDASYTDYENGSLNSNAVAIDSNTKFGVDSGNMRTYPIYYVHEADKDYSTENRYISYTDSNNYVLNPNYPALSRSYYEKQSIDTMATTLNTMLGILNFAADSKDAPNVRVAWDTYSWHIKDISGQKDDDGKIPFVSLKDVSGLSIDYNTEGGTKTDEGLAEAMNFKWSDSKTKYAILITDGAPQYNSSNSDRPAKNNGESDVDYLKRCTQTLINNIKNIEKPKFTAEGIKLMTVGLSMDDVEQGLQLLYDIADNNEKTGEHMFYQAEGGDDLKNILMKLVQSLLETCTVYGNVTDTIADGFYLVDATGKPLKAGDMIALDGTVTTDSNVPHGLVQPDGKTIKWDDQAFTPEGWHGMIFVKAKEDLLGGNSVMTNADTLTEKAAKFESLTYSTESSPNKRITLKDDISTSDTYVKVKQLESPVVNVNELDFDGNNTEWTVYLGEEVDPKKQLQALWEEILVRETVKKGTADDTNEDGIPDVGKSQSGNTWYPVVDNSIEDEREPEGYEANRDGTEYGAKESFRLADLIAVLAEAETDPEKQAQNFPWWDYGNHKIKWDKFIELAQMTTNTGGKEVVTGFDIPYHVYGINQEGSKITVKLTKEILEDEKYVSGGKDVTLEQGKHATKTVNGSSGTVPVEKYHLQVVYSPDYDVLSTGQGGSRTEDLHTGTFGTMYQGHAAGTETSDNNHIINAYKIPLEVYKTNEKNQPLKGASFKLYKEDKVNGTAVSGLESTKKYVEVAAGASDDEGIVQLKKDGASYGLERDVTYYLIETAAPENYKKLSTVWAVIVQTEVGRFTDLEGETIFSTITPDLEHEPPVVVGSGVTDDMYPFNWDQGARAMLNGETPLNVISRGATGGETTSITSGTFVSLKQAIAFRHTIKNLKSEKIELTAEKVWSDNSEPADITEITVKLYRVSDKGHTWGEGKVVPCTCTEKGVIEYTCSVCGETDKTAIDPKDHTPGEAHRENEIEPTCTEAGGYDMVVRCKICNAIITSEHMEIPRTEHSWVNQEFVLTDSTFCYDTVNVCSICNTVDETTRVHHNHVWGEWRVTVPAQKGVAGEEARVCEKGHVETKPIPALPNTTSIIINRYYNYYGYAWPDPETTTIDNIEAGSTIKISWRDSVSGDTLYQDTEPSSEQHYGYWVNSFSNSGKKTVMEQYHDSNNWWDRYYNYNSANLTVTDGMRLDIVSGNWRMPYEVTYQIVSTPNSSAPSISMRSVEIGSAFTAQSVLNSSLRNELLSAAVSEPQRNGTTAADPVQAYLDTVPDTATCKTGENNTYKEYVGEYKIIKENGVWKKLEVSDLPSENETGKPYTYYFIEVPVQGYEVSYSGQESGLNGDPDNKDVTITNTPKTKNFTFTKIWRDPVGTTNMVWPSDKQITVTIKQDNDEYARYTINYSNLAVGSQISDTQGDKVKLIVSSADAASGYVFTLTGLPFGSGENGYTYYVTEESVDGYQSPKYFSSEGTQAMGASRIGDGGTIYNDQVGVELPSTGGHGTAAFTIAGLTLAITSGAVLTHRASSASHRKREQ